ncbi:Twin-arginine translocation pathway signal [Rhodopseudomonas palustris HaA2]|uniref:Twin-arginine translocation pathway signal n=1 Tax=Rhodopseudomonas palustris (strain HaA2) TaxID=316058 RepID=Q2IWI6_RHOP2|nr:DUF3828 domain-containing protein [Rhodopseudomonas palustris]ABD07424.1 Twin-arginine translocation pathway signal [Rhodopseudomonas palustris HaA2]
MLSRRTFLIATASLAVPAAALAQATPPAKPPANDPTALLTRLYTASSPGGSDLVNSPKSRAKILSKSFAALWTRAEARTKDDIGPVDFDPVSNSQDPDIKAFAIKVEKEDDASATLAVTLTGSQPRDKAEDGVIRYDFVRDGGHWRIDDIRGAVDGEAWSVRKLLADSLKR